MISETEALERILKSIGALAPRSLPLARALNCFAGCDVLARISSPPFDNSAMDGYAVIGASCKRGARLRVVGEQPAGPDRGLSMQPGEAVRIFTGAPLPNGADAVVMQEDVFAEGEHIRIEDPVATGDFIRRRGGDVSEGQRILAAGEQINPQRLALLAGQGFGEVKVGGQVQCAIVSTGDELTEPGTPLLPGQIYESNAVLLRALLEKCGAAVASVEHSNDELPAVEAALRRGVERDVLVITGGVSVGARDAVKEVLRSIGAEIDLWRVAIKPGKPFLFGRAGNCAIFGLPGNPVSAFVTFLVFVRPALLRMMGAGDEELSLASAQAELVGDVENSGDRVHYLRGILADGKFSPVGRQESHALYGLSRSNALLRIAAGENLRAGQGVSVRIFP